jgi:hypothetical protein
MDFLLLLTRLNLAATPFWLTVMPSIRQVVFLSDDQRAAFSLSAGPQGFGSNKSILITCTMCVCGNKH